jgi:hypothetical protein
MLTQLTVELYPDPDEQPTLHLDNLFFKIHFNSIILLSLKSPYGHVSSGFPTNTN